MGAGAVHAGKGHDRFLTAVAVVVTVVLAGFVATVGACAVMILRDPILTDEDVCDSSDVPLLAAARSGDVDAVRVELDRGVSPDTLDRSRNSALGCAIPEDRADVVDLLLERGADPDLDTGAAEFMEVPLGLAVRRSPGRVVDALLAAGADPDRIDCRGSSVGSVLSGPYARGEVGALAALLDHGADPDRAVGGDGRTIDLLAHTIKTDDAEAARILLDHGAAPDGVGTDVPLTMALRSDRAEIVDLLLGHGASPDGRAGDRPLVVAAERQDPATVARLLAAGADPDAADRGGRRVVDAMFDLAIAHGDGPAVATALDLGADPRHGGWSTGLLDVIVGADHDALARALAAGVDPDVGALSGTDLALLPMYGRSFATGKVGPRIPTGGTVPPGRTAGGISMAGAGRLLSAAGSDTTTTSGAAVAPGASAGDDPRLAPCGFPSSTPGSTPLGTTSGSTTPGSTPPGSTPPPVDPAASADVAFTVTPLAMAVLVDDPWFVQALIDAGADPDGASVGGVTPLDLARIDASTATIDALVAAGAR